MDDTRLRLKRATLGKQVKAGVGPDCGIALAVARAVQGRVQGGTRIRVEEIRMRVLG